MKKEHKKDLKQNIYYLCNEKLKELGNEPDSEAAWAADHKAT